MRLTKKNYFSPWAERKYFSASQVKAMLRCPAAALADERPASTALLVGSYVDAAFEGKLDAFRAEHPEMLKKDGTLKADFVKAEEMIARAGGDALFTEYMKGRKQVVRTGRIGGLPFKIKMDVYRKGERIVDLKTVRDMRPGFADEWEWPLQMAIYQTVEGNRLPCFLAVITKEDPPDIEVIEIPQRTLDAERERLLEMLPRLDAYKRGILPAPRCGHCAYCRRTKKLTEPVLLS